MRRAAIGTAATLAAMAATAIAGATAIASAATGSAATTRPPTRAQVARAVHRATRSSYLWATVNVCARSARAGGVIGVRGEMPALGFDSALSMTIQLREAHGSPRRFTAMRGATARRVESPGTVRSGVEQDGAEFPFHADTGTLDASVTFTWTRAGHRLASVTRTTTGGHPSAAYGRPAHHTSATCRL